METVFDHNITKEEIVAVMGLPWTKEELLSMGGSQEKHYGIISRLYTYRGDLATAQKYEDMIPYIVFKL